MSGNKRKGHQNLLGAVAYFLNEICLGDRVERSRGFVEKENLMRLQVDVFAEKVHVREREKRGKGIEKREIGDAGGWLISKIEKHKDPRQVHRVVVVALAKVGHHHHHDYYRFVVYSLSFCFNNLRLPN